jgi:hypothetical protein
MLPNRHEFAGDDLLPLRGEQEIDKLFHRAGRVACDTRRRGRESR